jgi:hypothetical protein
MAASTGFVAAAVTAAASVALGACGSTQGASRQPAPMTTASAAASAPGEMVISPAAARWTPPGVKHWHGATSEGPMTHLALQENVDGKVVDWMEHVADDQYRNAVAADR